MSRSQLEQLLHECDLDPEVHDDLAGRLAALADLADEAPTPDEALLALFGETAPPLAAASEPGAGVASPVPAVVVPLPVRARRLVAGVVVLAVSGVGATGLSAAANTLPAALQRQVSDFARHHLPFDLPAPPRDEEPPLSLGSAPGPVVPTADPSGEPGPRVRSQHPATEEHAPSRSVSYAVARPARPRHLTPRTDPGPQPTRAPQPAPQPDPAHGNERPASSASPSPRPTPRGPDEKAPSAPASAAPQGRPAESSGPGGSGGSGSTTSPSPHTYAAPPLPSAVPVAGPPSVSRGSTGNTASATDQDTSAEPGADRGRGVGRDSRDRLATDDPVDLDLPAE